VVIAAVHSGFEQDAKKMTQRVIKACRNKHVDILAHPTSGHLGKREPVELDLKEVAKAAADANTCLEIDAFPIRLDLNSNNAYFAKNLGVKFAVNTDSHRIEHLDFMRYGVAVARRAWMTKKDVINTLGLKELLKMLRK
jgi:DNA polymerase (family X)